MKYNELTFTSDPDGRRVVGVLLSNRAETAWLYVEDYANVLKAYPHAVWGVVNNGTGRSYVRVKVPGRARRNLTVARLIAGDFSRTAVQFKDGNSFNLRNTNLMHVPGGGKCRKRLKGRAALRISSEMARV
ncbi:hypothetical protein [Methylorubrum thiocyanatum]|uniref:Uncharacterized protein n=1 Tax=Methylorubrum thiocyanatum TaxID=47958 RepID=A0AA40S767_9HYPH|nr:hypothetical protein [Methylorubrum thiocyanatum]MBA8915786.1 hypothetical protein [Methylorubrum thiocyanatum]GJE81240.1 hypothetical protein CJNNKLLH_2588 [Methylorubrum thiocyanatum]